MNASIMYMVKSMKLDDVANKIAEITGLKMVKGYMFHTRDYWYAAKTDNHNIDILVKQNHYYERDYDGGHPFLPFIAREEYDIEDIEVDIFANNCRDPNFYYFTDHPEIFIPVSEISLFDPDNPKKNKKGNSIANYKIRGPLPPEFR